MVRKAFFKALIFSTLIMLIISVLNPIFITKVGHRRKIIQGTYQHTGNAYDVLLMGSSHMNGGIDPNVLWKQYGITSFNYATGGQPIDVTYYLLKEALKNHTAQVVVLDLYYLGLTDKYGNDGYIRYVLDNMKFSKNKVEAIMDCTPPLYWITYLFPFVKYHTRWKELNEEDFNFDTSMYYYMKGFGAGFDRYGKDSLSDISTTETADIPTKTQEYLYKFIELSKEKGFKLVFINAPHDYTSTQGMSNWVKEPAKMFNKVAQISKENNIPFINYNNMFDEIGFDFKTDMENIGHVNYWGSGKLSSYLGKYLKQNYSLADHRDDPKYAAWNTEYKTYAQIESEQIMNVEKNAENFVSMLKNENYIISVSSNDYSSFKDDTQLKAEFNKLGLKFERSSANNNYIAVINNNKVVTEASGASILSDDFTFENNISLKVTTSKEDAKPGININGSDYSKANNGLNIVVYDKVLKGVVDSVYVGSDNVVRR